MRRCWPHTSGKEDGMEKLVQALYSGILYGSIYGLMAIGLTLIWGALRMLNMAHGALYLVGGYLAWLALNTLKLPSLAGLRRRHHRGGHRRPAHPGAVHQPYCRPAVILQCGDDRDGRRSDRHRQPGPVNVRAPRETDAADRRGPVQSSQRRHPEPGPGHHRGRGRLADTAHAVPRAHALRPRHPGRFSADGCGAVDGHSGDPRLHASSW